MVNSDPLSIEFQVSNRKRSERSHSIHQEIVFDLGKIIADHSSLLNVRNHLQESQEVLNLVEQYNDRGVLGHDI